MNSLKRIPLMLATIACVAVGRAQGNKLLDRGYWAAKPTLATVKETIKQGNSPIEMNSNSFNATVMAILGDAPLEDIKYLVSLKENDINTITHDGRTYIFWAAYKNNFPLVKYLVENGATVNLKDGHGIPLMCFATYGKVTDLNMFEYLMQQGADATLTTKENATLLLLALQYMDDSNSIDYFISKGLSLTDTDTNGNNAFFYAARGGNVSIMRYLLDKGIDPKAENANGENALLYAAHGTRGGSPSIETFSYLAKLGLAVNTTNVKGENALLLAAGNNKDVNVIDFLIHERVDVNTIDEDGNTALIKAASGNTIDVIHRIAENTKDVNHANKNGQTALMLAVQSGDTQTVAYLIKKGATANVVDKNGHTLLYYWANERAGRGFAKHPNTEKLTLLQEAGFVFTKAEPSGDNLWHLAVANGNMEFMEMAKKANIDINAKNKEGYTPLLLAALNAKNTKVLEYLVANGADKKITTDFDETAYDLASENEILKKDKKSIKFLK